MWASIIVFCATLADIFTPIPIVGSVVAGFYWVIFGIYLWLTGHGLLNWRRLAPGIVSFAIEMFPAIQAAPTIIAATIAIISLSHIEDRFKIPLLPKKHLNGRLPARKQPFYQNGVGMPRGTEEVSEDNV